MKKCSTSLITREIYISIDRYLDIDISIYLYQYIYIYYISNDMLFILLEWQELNHLRAPSIREDM